MSSMVEIEALTKQFSPITAVDGVSFSVDRGEVLGFLGPNGAGKSTTMKMVTGFLTPDGGRVRIDGHDLATHPIAVKACIGYLPEGAPLYGDMTPAGFLDFIADVRGLKGAKKKQRIDEVIERVHLQGVLYQRTETLSKGFKRRVGLAQAILHDPDVLILDEPTDGLDPNQKHEVRSLIREMAEDKVIVLSTHILEEVDAVCSRAVIIAKGKVLSDGTPEQLLAHSPDHNSVRVVLSCSDPAVVADTLRVAQGIGDVSLLTGDEQLAAVPGTAAFLVRPNGAAAVTGTIGAVVHAHGWAVHEMHVMRGRLDEVFRDITGSAYRGEPS